MKHKLSKLTSLFLAVAMALAMAFTAVPAKAETTKTGTISVKTDDTHTYAVYQIFTGELSGSTLSNLKWGESGTGDVGTTVDDATIKSLTDLNSGDKSDTEKLAVINTLVKADATAYKTVDKDTPSGTITAGYYLIKDLGVKQSDDTYTIPDNDANSTFITEVVGSTEIAPKKSVPSSDKTVQDETGDAEEGADNEGYGKSADHAINESFQFKLTATIPADSHLADYSTYPIKFSDTMSEGITFESIDSVTVKQGDTTVTLGKDDYTLSTITTADNGDQTWTLETKDLKQIEGITLGTGEITVEVVYNAHLNEKAQINGASDTTTTNKNTSHIEYRNNPNAEGTGKTPDQDTYVYTFKINNKKVKDTKDGNPLPGAEFKLYESNGTTEVGLIYDETLKVYRPVKSGETATAMTSAEDGTFNIVGLDAGTYVLKETKTPDGYSTAADLTVIINATHKGNTVTIDQEKSQNIDNTIVDKSGSTLPSTGGIGTTIFYVVGGILVAGAAILLITRRRTER